MSQVWESGPQDKAETLVLLALADFCNDDGECWPSVASIARKARMTERGAQKIIARLVGCGWVHIDQNAGRRGCNLYTVSAPEHGSPRTVFTPNASAKPPNTVPRTPEPRSPEPSYNHQEPSLCNGAREVRDHLEKWASPDAVSSFIAYRRKQKGKALTVTAAKRQATQLERIFQARGDPDDALGMAEERGWQSVQADWYFKAKGNQDDNRDNNPNGSGPSRSGNGMADAFAAVAARYATRDG